VFIYGVNEHKKGQFELARVGKLIEKQFRFALKRSTNFLEFFIEILVYILVK
jgi:hypothetical protein